MERSRLLAVLALSLIAISAVAQEAGEGTEDLEASPQQRQQWFYGQRAFPNKVTPPGAHFKAMEQARQMREMEATIRAGAPGNAALSSWTLVGPQPSDQSAFGYGLTSGRITSIAVDPTTSGSSTVIYIGGAEGGIWKSTNNGSTWTPLTDGQTTLAIGCIAIDPNNHLNIYAGTGEENFSGDSYYGGGILKSTNGGASWTMLGQSAFGGPLGPNNGGSYIGSIAIQPGAGSSPVILVTTEYASGTQNYNSGIYRSTNGGTTWTHVLPTTNDEGSFGTSVFFAADGTAWAAIGGTGGDSYNGVYKSTNQGATWVAANGTSGTPLPTGTAVGRITLVGAPSSASTLYASIQDPSTSGLINMYKTVNGGATWTAIHTPLGAPGTTNDFCTFQCWYDMPLAVSPTNANVLYAGGSFNYTAGNGGVYVTTNGGTTGTGAWAPLNPGTNSVKLHPDIHAFAFSGDTNTLYIGEDGGIWSAAPTNSLTAALTDLNNGLAITEFYPGLAIYAGNKNIALNGVQDNGTQLYNGSLEWTVVRCGDGAWAAIDPTNSNNMYAGCTSKNTGPWRSLTGGSASSWTQLDPTGINSSDAVGFIPPMIMDPNNSTTLYYGTSNLYKMTSSTGTSPTWNLLAGPLVINSGAYLTTIAVAEGNSNNIFVGGSDGTVGFTTNAGANWTQTISILPARSVTMVQGDPHVSTTFYVTFSGFNGGAGGHVFQCLTGTNACTDISGNLPDTPTNDIVIDPDHANTYYVATDVGVFTTTDGGTAWSTAGTGLPNVAVVGLKLHEGSRTLRAATHGRSTWDLSLSASAPATMVSPTNGSTLSSSTVKFTWTAGTGVSHYSLYLGSTVGAHDIAAVNAGTNLTATVTNVPTYGGKLYVTLYSLIGGTYQSNAYTYTEAKGSPVAATLISPVNAKLTSKDQTFTWTTGSDVSHYNLYIGTQPGAHDVDFINAGLSQSATVSNLPTNGGELFITLYSLIGSSYQSHAYTDTAAGTPAKATLTAPTGSTITGKSATFDWSAGTGVTSYSLYVGTTAGADNLDYFHSATAHTYSVTNLPGTGKVYVTLYSEIDGKWQSATYTFTNN